MKFKLLFSYRFLLLILSVIGVYLQLKHWWSADAYITPFYLTQAGHVLYGETWFGAGSEGVRPTSGYSCMKGAVTMSIMITCVIYHFMLLAPLATPEKFYRLETSCHYIVPLMFFFDTLVIDKKPSNTESSIPLFDLIPLTYMPLALPQWLVLKWPIPGAKDSPCLFLYQCTIRLAFVGKWVVWSFLSLPLSWLCAYGDQKYQAEMVKLLVKPNIIQTESCF